MSIIDLDKQFVFYASYHHNNINKLIHIFCVWPILWSAMIFLQYTPVLVPQLQELPVLSTIASIHPLNGAFFFALFYAIAYLLMEQKGAGALAATLVTAALLSSLKFYHTAQANYGYSPLLIAAVVHVGCWVAQFVGHGKFEGRAPALLDNLVQAFLMAPLFVLLELLFNVGYQKDFQRKISKKVEAEIASFKRSQKAKGK